MSRLSLSMLLLLLTAGCAQDDPASPYDPQLAMNAGADVLKPTLREAFDNTVPAICLGESLRFTGTLVVRGFFVNTPSGLTRLHVLGADIEDGRVVGVSSGAEWMMTHFVLRTTQRLDGGAIRAVLAMEHDWLVNAAGDRLRASNHVTVVFNAQGEMVTFRWEIVDCEVFRAR